MKKAIVVLMAIFTFSALAGDTTYALKNFQKALKIKIGDISKSEDLRLTIYKSDLPSCDSAGASLIADLEVRRSQEIQSSRNGTHSTRSHFEKIKSYSVSLAAAEQLKGRELYNSIIADDECFE